MKIVAVTACPSGVAHTYMSAEALERSAKAKGIEVKVETQGSIGIENKLTPSDIEAADIVVLTKDIGLKETERFKVRPDRRQDCEPPAGAVSSTQVPEIIEISPGRALKRILGEISLFGQK
jgi:fructose-specific PTS system IIB-like component